MWPNKARQSNIAHTARMDIFQHLVVDLDTEGEWFVTWLYYLKIF